MKRILVLIVVAYLSVNSFAQTKAELEKQREDALSDIAYMDNLLKLTSEERKESMGRLNMISRKLNLRESVIVGIKSEMELIESRIELNALAINMMESDLDLLIKEYEKAIVNAQKVSKGNPEIAYIMSSRDLNQGYKRIKYLQQLAKYRRKEAEIILALKDEIERNRKNLELDYSEVNSLRNRELEQKDNLQREQRNKRNIINRLGKEERQLKRDLDKKRRIAIEIEKEIERVIEEERRRRTSVELTPEEELLGEDFSKNMGRLPWPVSKGLVTSHFGVHDHPVIKGTKVDNIGVEITSGAKESARAVFKGRVMSVFGISGGNMAVIIRHGRYLTVYQNLVKVNVKPGDTVETKELIGEVFSDSDEKGKSVIKFMVYEEKDKQDPERWLAKRR